MKIKPVTILEIKSGGLNIEDIVSQSDDGSFNICENINKGESVNCINIPKQGLKNMYQILTKVIENL